MKFNWEQIILAVVQAFIAAFAQQQSGAAPATPPPAAPGAPAAPRRGRPPGPPAGTPPPAAPPATPPPAGLGDEITVDTLRAVGTPLIQAKKGAEVKAILTKFGATNFSTVPPEHFEACLADLEALSLM